MNDGCATALPATLGSTVYDTTGATNSAPAFSCEVTQGQSDVWFTFVAPNTMPYRFDLRSEEHTSELQSPVPSSYAVFCLKKKKQKNKKKQKKNMCIVMNKLQAERARTFTSTSSFV